MFLSASNSSFDMIMSLYMFFLALVMVLTINHFIKPYQKMSTLSTTQVSTQASWKL